MFTRKQKKRILIIAGTFVLLILALATFLYLRPMDKPCSENSYYYKNKVLQNLLDIPSYISCNSIGIHTENTGYVESVQRSTTEVTLKYLPLNKSESSNDFLELKLPANKLTNENIPLIEESYVKIYLDLKDNLFDRIMASGCDLFKGKNCSMNVTLDKWNIALLEPDEIKESNQSFSDEQKAFILDNTGSWLMTGGYTIVQHPLSDYYIHTVEGNDYKIQIAKIAPYLLQKQSIKAYASLSETWKSISNQAIDNSLAFIKADFTKLLEQATPAQNVGVSCLDTNTLINNINICGDQCKKVLDTNFMNKVNEMCTENKDYNTYIDYYNKKLNSASFVTDYFTEFTHILNTTLSPESYVPNEKYLGPKEELLFRYKSDFVKEFAYVISQKPQTYTLPQGKTKEQILNAAYFDLLNDFRKRNYEFFGICDVGNVALNIYGITKNPKLLEDAKTIYKYGKILKSNTYPYGVQYMSGNNLRESFACADFLLEYSGVDKESNAKTEAVKILKDRIGRSWAIANYPGGFGYNDNYSGNETGGGFYDYTKTSTGHYYKYDSMNQMYILSIISRIK